MEELNEVRAIANSLRKTHLSDLSECIKYAIEIRRNEIISEKADLIISLLERGIECLESK